MVSIDIAAAQGDACNECVDESHSPSSSRHHKFNETSLQSTSSSTPVVRSTASNQKRQSKLSSSNRIDIINNIDSLNYSINSSERNKESEELSPSSLSCQSFTTATSKALFSAKKIPKHSTRKKSSLALTRTQTKPIRSVSFFDQNSKKLSASKSSHRSAIMRMSSLDISPNMNTVSYSPITATTTTTTTAAAAAVAVATTIPSANMLISDPTTAGGDNSDNMEMNNDHISVELSSSFDSKRVQTYKDRRKTYRMEKKKLADELISAIQDPTILIMSDWLKVRTTLKQWNKYYCELRPGSLYLYKNQKIHKSSNWIGTVMLKMCELIERPSKKNGFCFKLFHPLDHPIWAPKGPHGEAFISLMFSLPASSIIFRAPSIEAGKKWMEAIELTFKYYNMIIPKNSQQRDSAPTTPLSLTSNGSGNAGVNHSLIVHSAMLNSFNAMNSIDRSEEDLLESVHSKPIFNESEIEKHFDLDDEGHTDHGEHDDSQEHHTTESDDSFCDEEKENILYDNDSHKNLLNSSANNKSSTADHSEVVQTVYIFDGGNEEFGLVGDAGQTEEVPEENKSLLWTLLKQVRPGMDLSKVVLPTFILEPRSFLEKLTDYYYHCDIISKAVLEDDPLLRMKLILKWYLSGFYKKPKGLKKPYNPILGETFRCHWQHTETKSKTFYIAEQVSHHPPVSAFYVTNRQDGFCISGSILAKSKFYGNSISAILEGTARLTLLTRGEDYLITFPYAHCKGIFLGPLAFELGGKVSISCNKTGYKTELEFKLKPFFASEDQCNLIIGKLKLGNETLGTIEGHWDSKISYKDKRKGDSELFWSGVDPKVKSRRLKRFVVPLTEQLDNESEKLWNKVTIAIQQQDQQAATMEKTFLEEAQRELAKMRTLKMEAWTPKLFVLEDNVWQYKMADTRPWDARTDVQQYEHNYVIQTLFRHKNSKSQSLAFKSIDDNKSLFQSSLRNRGKNRNKLHYRRHVLCTDSEMISSAYISGNKVDEQSNLLADDEGLVGRPCEQLFNELKIELSTLNQSISTLEQTQYRLMKDIDWLGSKICQATQNSTSNQIPCGTSSFSITRYYLTTFIASIPAEIRSILIFFIMFALYNWLFSMSSARGNITTVSSSTTSTIPVTIPPLLVEMPEEKLNTSIETIQQD